MKNIILLISITFVLFTISCGGDNSTGPAAEIQSFSKEIGVDGGTIDSGDSLLKITIPAGALTESKNITITPNAEPNGSIPGAYISANSMVQLEPHGLTFQQPVILSMKYDQGEMREGSIEEQMISFYYINDDSTIENAPTTINMTENIIEAEISHFSFGGPLTVAIKLVNKGVIDNPTVIEEIANRIIDELNSLPDEQAREDYYMDNIDLLGPFININEEILGENPIAESFPDASFPVPSVSTLPVAVLFGEPERTTNSTFTNIDIGGIDVIYYRYRLDGGTWSADTVIDIPINISGLSEGSHNIDVLGGDFAGNWQEEASATSWTWDITIIPPSAVLIGEPMQNSGSRTIYIQVGGYGIVSYKYNLDGGGWSVERDITLPIIGLELANGEHTIEVTGKDSTGTWQEETSATSWTWNIDFQPPVSSLSGTPSDPTNSTSINITVNGSSDMLAYRYNIDAAGWGSLFDYTLPIIEAGLSAGQHTIEVIGMDIAGNWQDTGSATAFTWTIDTDPPTAEMSGVPDNPSDSTDISIAVSGTEVVSYRYNLDGSGWSAEVPVGTLINVQDLTEGLHTLEIIGKDIAGNWQDTLTATSHTWLIDLSGNIADWFVDSSATTGADNGTSWDDAFLEIQDALSAASAGDVIWVAQGTYIRQGSDNTVLDLKDNIQIYGGFPSGGETMLNRDPSTYTTVLDGQDLVDHVVIGKSNCTIDGFTITNGLADGSDPNNNGAGMINDSATGVLIENCKFLSNNADNRGGGMYNINSEITVKNTIFDTNTSINGGGIYNDNSSLSIDKVDFAKNSVMPFGAVSAISNNGNCDMTIRRSNFSENDDYISGTIFTDAGNLLIENSIFYKNHNELNGGPVYNNSANITINNTNFTKNESSGSNLITNASGNITITNSIIWDNSFENHYYYLIDNSITVSNSIVDVLAGHIDGGGNIDANPNFIDPENGDLRIGQSSPCIDAANYDSAPITDMNGNTRVDDAAMPNTGTGTLPIADIGAYEFTSTTSLRLTSPNGSEELLKGVSTNIEWTSSGITNVKIEASIDNGGTWSTITSSTTAGTGSFQWSNIQLTGSSKCLIRISDTDNSSIRDLSDKTFFIKSSSTLFVDTTASGDNSGISWSNAFNQIQDAADNAEFGDEIHVAAGIYNRIGSEDLLLTLKEGVKFYGAFPQGGGELIDRDYIVNVTTLDGASLVDHVVVGADYAVLDGFTITGGIADTPGLDSYGGGIAILSASPVISNCTIINNNASMHGGGMIIIGHLSQPSILNCSFDSNISSNGNGIYISYYARPTIDNCIFTNNSTSGTGFGGGINASDFSSPIITNCEFTGNNSGFGSGVSLTNVLSGAILDNCIFYNNTSSTRAGGLYLSSTSIEITDCIFNNNNVNYDGGAQGGAVYQYGSSSSSFINCIFYGNEISGTGSANGGGAIYNYGTTSANLINCTLYGNTVSGTGAQGGAVYLTDGTLTLLNTIIWDNTASEGNGIFIGGTGTIAADYSDIQDWGGGGTGNLVLDPLFITGPEGDYYLDSVSPCLNTGDPATLQSVWDIITGKTTNISGTEDTGTIDMGYHYVP